MIQECSAAVLNWSLDSWHLIAMGVLTMFAVIFSSLTVASFWYKIVLGYEYGRHQTYDNGVSVMFLVRVIANGPTFKTLCNLVATTTRRRLYSGFYHPIQRCEIWLAGHPALVKHIFNPANQRLWHKIDKPGMNALAFSENVPNEAMLYTGDDAKWKHAREAWSPFFLQTDFNTFDDKIDEIVEKHLVRLLKYRDGNAELLELMLFVTVDLLCQTLYGALLPQLELNILTECLAEFTVPSTTWRGKYPGNLSCYDYHQKIAREISEKAPDGVFIRTIVGDEKMTQLNRYENCAFFLEALTPAFASFWTISNIIMKSTTDKGTKQEALSDPIFREKCIKETLRLYPPVPTLWARIANKTHVWPNPLYDESIKDERGFLAKMFFKPDIRTVQDITIKKGTNIFVIPGPFHYDDRIWQNAEVFLPSRWDKDPLIIKDWSTARKKRATTWGALTLNKGQDMDAVLRKEQESLNTQVSGYDSKDIPLRYKLFGPKVEGDIRKENLEHLKVAASNEEYMEWSFFPFGLGKHQCLGRRLAVKMVDGIVANLLSYDVNFANGNIPNLFKRHWTDRLNSVSAVYNYPADPVYVEFGELQGDIGRIGAMVEKGRKTRKTHLGKGSGFNTVQLGGLNEGGIKSAVLFISCQNEFLDAEGKLYDKVKDVMSSLGTKEHLKELMEAAITSNSLVIHAPVCIDDKFAKGGFDEWGLSEMKGMFARGAKGTEFYKDTACSSDDVILGERKGNDLVTGTSLLSALENGNIERLFIAGLLTDVTVENTVKQLAKKLKGKVTLHPVSDATATMSMDAQNATFNFVLAKHSKPVDTEEAVVMLESGEDM